ncbi:hypothetical protein [Kitasatospora griseola]|uniref:hypothetical protein n=1 Tax=Kitasatospora griseola TaxID=2064 RepID=UPI000699211B|nr:hypothetical protein [Kitasatospora griseola]
MRFNRPTVAAALAASALALTACEPDSSGTGAAAPASAAPSATATSTANGGQNPTAPGNAGAASPNPAASTGKPAGGTSAKPTGAPADDCSRKGGAVDGGAVVEAVEATAGAKFVLRARPTKFVCGPNVPGEPYFEATGSTETYEFAPGAKAYVLNQAKPEQASVDFLVKLVQGCKGSAHTAPAPYLCYANQFIVQFDQQGRITSATQMYRA